MNRVVVAAIAAVALSACGPQDPTNEEAPEQLGQQQHALTVSVYCSADYGFAKCFATPAGGTGPYTYTWASYNPYAVVTASGSMATVTPPSCGGQFGVRVDIRDALGAYAAGFSYANCY